MRGLNKATLVGRLGADVEVFHTKDGQKIATLRLATDEGYKDRNSGEWVNRAEWHRVVTFQEGLIGVLEEHAKKGRLTLIEGKLRTRKYRKDGEETDRFTTEILIVPGGQVQFLEPLGDRDADGHPPQTDEQAPQADQSVGENDFDDQDIPF